MSRLTRRRFVALSAAASLPLHAQDNPLPATEAKRRFLYVAVPGIRDYLEFGGHGVLVFDMDAGYKFVRRIKAAGFSPEKKPLNVKGICASQSLGRLYVSCLRSLTCFDLHTDAILWEKEYTGGCDRMAITPDGKTIYLPSLEAQHWHVIDAEDGKVLSVIKPDSGAHNTVASRDGREVYLAGLRSPLLTVADTSKRAASRTVGPFSASIRPFTVDGKAQRCYCCVNELLGFEVGDLHTEKKLHQVTAPGYSKGPVKRHGCPSHGVGLTPDEREVWLCDAFNESLHIFNNQKDPPEYSGSIKVREQPGWVTFTLDGKHALPSTGEIIDVATRKVVTTLTDETGAAVHSEKMVEVQFTGKAITTGDQFGLGRVTT